MSPWDGAGPEGTLPSGGCEPRGTEGVAVACGVVPADLKGGKGGGGGGGGGEGPTEGKGREGGYFTQYELYLHHTFHVPV